jgi:hypothetical protein
MQIRFNLHKYINLSEFIHFELAQNIHLFYQVFFQFLFKLYLIKTPTLFLLYSTFILKKQNFKIKILRKEKFQLILT